MLTDQTRKHSQAIACSVLHYYLDMILCVPWSCLPKTSEKKFLSQMLSELGRASFTPQHTGIKTAWSWPLVYYYILWLDWPQWQNCLYDFPLHSLQLSEGRFYLRKETIAYTETCSSPKSKKQKSQLHGWLLEKWRAEFMPESSENKCFSPLSEPLFSVAVPYGTCLQCLDSWCLPYPAPTGTIQQGTQLS